MGGKRGEEERGGGGGGGSALSAVEDGDDLGGVAHGKEGDHGEQDAEE